MVNAAVEFRTRWREGLAKAVWKSTNSLYIAKTLVKSTPGRDRGAVSHLLSEGALALSISAGFGIFFLIR
jgi:hypothetical protein